MAYATTYGQQTLKIEFQGDLRRITVDMGTFKYVDLVDLCTERFGPELLPPVNTKYKDDDGDICTIASDEELSEAFRMALTSGQTLRVIVRSGDLISKFGSPKEASRVSVLIHCDEGKDFQVQKQLKGKNRKVVVRKKLNKTVVPGSLKNGTKNETAVSVGKKKENRGKVQWKVVARKNQNKKIVPGASREMITKDTSARSREKKIRGRMQSLDHDAKDWLQTRLEERFGVGASDALDAMKDADGNAEAAASRLLKQGNEELCASSIIPQTLREEAQQFLEGLGSKTQDAVAELREHGNITHALLQQKTSGIMREARSTGAKLQKRALKAAKRQANDYYNNSINCMRKDADAQFKDALNQAKADAKSACVAAKAQAKELIEMAKSNARKKSDDTTCSVMAALLSSGSSGEENELRQAKSMAKQMKKQAKNNKERLLRNVRLQAQAQRSAVLSNARQEADRQRQAMVKLARREARELRQSVIAAAKSASETARSQVLAAAQRTSSARNYVPPQMSSSDAEAISAPPDGAPYVIVPPVAVVSAQLMAAPLAEQQPEPAAAVVLPVATFVSTPSAAPHEDERMVLMAMGFDEADVVQVLRSLDGTHSDGDVVQLAVTHLLRKFPSALPVSK